MAVFITGVGSGFGVALAKIYLDLGESVYGISRSCDASLCRYKNFHFISVDLSVVEDIKDNLSALDLPELDLVILNAGILGEIEDMEQTSVDMIKKVMDINLYANKEILDFLISMKLKIKQIVAISSGASVNGNKGWGSYSLSKASLNMLMQLYAHEFEHTHLSSLAPGLILTDMLKGIMKNADPKSYPSVLKLKNGDKMTPTEAAQMMIQKLPVLRNYESGIFLDIRNL